MPPQLSTFVGSHYIYVTMVLLCSKSIFVLLVYTSLRNAHPIEAKKDKIKVSPKGTNPVP